MYWSEIKKSFLDVMHSELERLTFLLMTNIIDNDMKLTLHTT